MINNDDIKAAVESCGLHYILVTNASELDTIIHQQMPADGTDLVVNFVDTSGAYQTRMGRTYETRNMLLIYYNEVDFTTEHDALLAGASQEGKTSTHKGNAMAVIKAINASGKFEIVNDWAFSVNPFDTSDVCNGLWTTFTLIDSIGECAQ